MSDDRLAEVEAYRDELYGKNLVGPQHLINIKMDSFDWLVGQAGKAARLRRDLELVQLLIGEALTTDGAHHKQWYLEQIVARLKLDVPDHERGIGP